MIYKFSNASKKALENAENIAIELGHNFIGTEHILYGIALEETGIAHKVLKKQNIDAYNIYLKIKEIFGEGKIILNKTDGFTPKSKKIIEKSFKEIENKYLSTIGTELILLSILNDRDNMAYRILVDLNINLDQSYEEIFNYMIQVEELEKSSKNNNKKKIPNNILTQFGTDLNKLALEGKMDNVIGREKEIERIIQILSRRRKNNPCLIGEPGVGKTAIVEGLAKKIINKEVPEILENKVVFNLDLTSMVAGAKYRGDFEERIKKCLNEVIKMNNVIIFIDEIHTIVGAGAAEGAIDASNILKPLLARGDIQLIGATTIDEYTKYIEKDSALERRFCPIIINEPSINETIHILNEIKEQYEKYHNILIPKEVIEECVKLSDRYIYNRNMPDKAIDVLDETASKVKMKTNIIPEELKKLENEINKISEKKENAIMNQQFEIAADLRTEEIKVKNEYEIKLNEWKKDKNRIKITVKDVREVISNLTNIPIENIIEEKNVKTVELENKLKNKIIGQDNAISQVCKAVIRGKAGINDPNRPIGSFLFLGPTGVGKTELTKELAKYLLGSEKSIIKLDMSEYMESYSVSKIIGAPPGYIGFSEETNLTKIIRKNPYSIIVFDEIEKAHSDVLNILLQILDEGILTDSNGRKINFKNTIIIMTSNIGAEKILNDKKIGFGEYQIENKKTIVNELKKHFRSEFLNRIDDIVIFNKLTKENLLKIFDIELDKIRERSNKKNVNLVVNDEVKRNIIENELDLNFGARDLKRKIKEIIENVVAMHIIEDNIKEKKEIIFGLKDEKIYNKIQ